ncbi:MAG: hypothetical protein MJZ37_00255 [Bacilli bacterium]|nr:hypothetical protein [Bacilli bacterium]
MKIIARLIIYGLFLSCLVKAFVGLSFWRTYEDEIIPMAAEFEKEEAEYGKNYGFSYTREIYENRWMNFIREKHFLDGSFNDVVIAWITTTPIKDTLVYLWNIIQLILMLEGFIYLYNREKKIRDEEEGIIKDYPKDINIDTATNDEIYEALKQLDPTFALNPYSRGEHRDDLIRKYKEAKQMSDDYDYTIKIHKRYKKLYWFFLFFWILAPFFIPLIIAGVGGLMLSSFIFFITVPAGIFMGSVVWPLVLKQMIFVDDEEGDAMVAKGKWRDGKKVFYSEVIMEKINLSREEEKTNTASLLTGNILSKFFK